VIANGAKSLLTDLNPLTQNSKNQAKNFRQEFWILKHISFEMNKLEYKNGNKEISSFL
jgi:lipopolysaccharide transport system ATP-binding protein